jgi:hypothetical protein
MSSASSCRDRCDRMKELNAEHRKILSGPPPALDRRQHERIALKIPLRVLSYGLLMEKADEAICTDLSEGGVAFDTAAELNVGDIVILEFHQRGELTYRCHARLSYRMGQRYGARFLAA